MDELTDGQVSRLAQTVNQGQIIRAWCQHPGFALYKQALQDIIADKKNTWLQGTEESAKEARIRAQGVNEAFLLLTKFMTQGDAAAKVLNEYNAPVAEK